MRAEGFSCSLDNGHSLERPRDKETAIFYQKNINFLPAINLFTKTFLIIKTLDTDPDWYSA